MMRALRMKKKKMARNLVLKKMMKNWRKAMRKMRALMMKKKVKMKMKKMRKRKKKKRRTSLHL